MKEKKRKRDTRREKTTRGVEREQDGIDHCEPIRTHRERNTGTSVKRCTRREKGKNERERREL